MRLAILTDAHANLPALQAALAAIDRLGVDLTVHTGDAIGIGPHPRECVELLAARPATACLMGNHDAWYAFGLPEPRPAWMSEGEQEHQRWTHAAMGDDLRATISTWPYTLAIETAAGSAECLHFARKPNGDFIGPSSAPTTGEAADALFGTGARFLFYGHHHDAADLSGIRTRYINPGSLGCSPTPVARIAILDVRADDEWDVSMLTAPYDPASLLRDFDRFAVPERDFIRRVFMPFASGAG